MISSFNFLWNASNRILLLITIIGYVLIKQFGWNKELSNNSITTIDGDSKGYYMYLPNFFIHGNIQEQKVDDRYIYSHHSKGVNKYFVGSAVLMSPFFGLGYIIASVKGYPLDGYSIPFQKAISLSGLFYFILGLYFLSGTLKMFGFSQQQITIAVLLIAFGTNLLFYAIIQPGMSHIYSWFAVNGFVYYAKKLSLQYQPKYLYLTALALGLIILIRPLNGLVIFLLPFIFYTRAKLNQFWKQLNVQDILIAVALLFLAVFIQMLVWKAQADSWLIWGYKGEGFNFTNPQIGKVLFSFRKGLFIYTPMLALAVLGLVVLIRKNTYAGISLLGFLMLLTYFIASWWNWYYGPSFGQRGFVEFYAIAAILCCFLMDHLASKPQKITASVFAIAFIGLNLIQSYQIKANILSTWDMNWEKYQYSFLKVDDHYRGKLGGNKDMLPYDAEKNLIAERQILAEDSIIKYSYHWALDSLSNKQVIDYSDREYNFSLRIPIQENEGACFAEIELSRLEKDQNSCSESVLVLEYLDAGSTKYAYYPIVINEAPDSEINSWRRYNYQVLLPKLNPEVSTLHCYIWNPYKRSFFIKDVSFRLFKI